MRVCKTIVVALALLVALSPAAQSQKPIHLDLDAGASIPEEGWTCTLWHEIYPDYCTIWHLTVIEGDGSLRVGNTVVFDNRERFVIDHVGGSYHWDNGVVTTTVEDISVLDPVVPPVGVEHVVLRSVNGVVVGEVVVITDWVDVDGDGVLSVGDRVVFDNVVVEPVTLVRVGLSVTLVPVASATN